MNRNDRAITGFTMAGHGMVHTYELSVPILMTVWLVEFPVTTATLGTVVAVGYGLFGVGALPGGLLVDRFGSRRLIVACLFGMGGSFLLLGVAPGVVGITIALAVWGLAASVYHPAGLALISRGVEDRGRGFAYHGVAGNVGIAGGPLATTLALTAVGWRTVAGALVVPAAAGALYASRAEFDERAAVDEPRAGDATVEPDDSRSGPASIRSVLADSRALFAGPFALAFVVVVLSGLYYRGLLTFLPTVAGIVGGLPALAVGGATVDPGRYLYVGLLAVGVVGQYLGGRLSDAVHPTRVLPVGFAALCLLGLAYLPAASAGPVPFLAVTAALGVCLFALQPLYQSTIAETTPADGRGLSYGYTYLGVFGVGAAGGAIAGAALSYADPTTLFFLLAGIAAAAVAVATVLARRATAPSVASSE
ncbi:MFS transporter [Halobacteriales archaeon SW_7_68_16]|nr:MAG: MFS transporter [Halobacteriales archaeon SW_7_68_16]